MRELRFIAVAERTLSSSSRLFFGMNEHKLNLFNIFLKTKLFVYIHCLGMKMKAGVQDECFSKTCSHKWSARFDFIANFLGFNILKINIAFSLDVKEASKTYPTRSWRLIQVRGSWTLYDLANRRSRVPCCRFKRYYVHYHLSVCPSVKCLLQHSPGRRNDAIEFKFGRNNGSSCTQVLSWFSHVCPTVCRRVGSLLVAKLNTST